MNNRIESIAPSTSHLSHDVSADMLRPGLADVLEVPMNKRMLVQYALNEEGVKELRLFHGDKEVSFDEPDLFAFGETLAKQSRFIAGSALQWGAGYSWDRLRPLFEVLVDEGIVRPADEGANESASKGDRSRISLLPEATCTRPRSWFEVESITQELAGRSVELGYLEVIVPIFRVAHISMDSDGRHVGEANVFPRALRTETPTEWITCIYPGTRYMAEEPMNVTALKAMRQHWSQMMAVLHHVRMAYLARFPAARDGWTIGHLERLATSVLCISTYQLMRCDKPVANGELHPALSSLFRVTDGLRLVMHEMLFVPVGEKTRLPDDAISSEEILAYAERNFSFHSQTGVCAGPRHLVQEFLSVVVDGAKAEQHHDIVFDPQVQKAVDEIDHALDYALLGLQTYAVTYSLWPLTTRAYEKLAHISVDAVNAGHTGFASFAERMNGHLINLRTSPFLAHESWRADREFVYSDMYGSCGRGVTTLRDQVSLQDAIAPEIDQNSQEFEACLRGHLIPKLAGTAPGHAHLEDILACIVDFAMRTKAILKQAGATQTAINRLLGRATPKRHLAAPDLDVHSLLQGEETGRLPYLLDELAAAFGLCFDIDEQRLMVSAIPRGEAA